MTEIMSMTYYPKSMELLEGTAYDIDDGGRFVMSFSPDENAKSADAPLTAPGHKDGIRMKKAAPFILKRHKNRLERNELRKEFRRGTLSPAGMNRYQSLTKSADLNDSAIHQITIVQFVQQMIGQISTLNVINRAFTRVPADNLRGKIPEGGAPGVSVQVKRLQEPTITHTDFGQTAFRIRRNDLHLYISREDRMEATIDPLAFSSMQGNKLLMQTRDLLALKELSKIPSITDNPFPSQAGKTIGSSAMHFVPRAAADSIGIFQKILVDQFIKWRNEFKYIIMHPLDYRIHETNFYSRNKTGAQPSTGNSAIRPFTGLEPQGVTAIISPWVPRNIAYFLTNEGCYELDGPKVVDAEYDARKFADYFPVRDFVGYLIVHPERFATKAVLNIEDLTTGTEITTDAQIQKMVELPENAVQKSDNP